MGRWTKKMPSPEERLRALVDVVGGCWIYPDHSGKANRSQFRLGRDHGQRRVSFQAAAYFFKTGKIISGHDPIVWPNCGTLNCCNPEHMNLVAAGDVVLLQKEFNPEKYPCGHPRTAKNTYVMSGKGTCRTCQACRNEARRLRMKGQLKMAAVWDARKANPKYVHEGRSWRQQKEPPEIVRRRKL